MRSVNSCIKRIAGLFVAGAIAVAVAVPSLPASAQRFGGRSGGGSFGRSSSGFGGGSFGSGGGSFGRSSGSLGGSSRSFGGSSSSGSFGRSGAFGSRSYTGSSSVYSYGGRSAHYYGGYGDYWYHPAWYYWMPFHPAFYYGAPYIGADGFYHPGGFSFFRLIFGLLLFAIILGFIGKMFFGGRSVRYTTYN